MCILLKQEPKKDLLDKTSKNNKKIFRGKGMSWIDHLWQNTKVRANQLWLKNKKPEIVLEEAFCHIQQNLIALRQTVAEAIALQKRLERQMAENQAKALECYHQARSVLSQGNENLAKKYLARRQNYQKNVTIYQSDLENQRKSLKKLKIDLSTIERRIAEVKLKKEIYIARALSAEAAVRIENFTEKLNQQNTSEGIEAKITILDAQLELIEALNNSVNTFTE